MLFDELVHNSSVMGLRLGGWHQMKAAAAQQRQRGEQPVGLVVVTSNFF